MPDDCAGLQELATSYSENLFRAAYAMAELAKSARLNEVTRLIDVSDDQVNAAVIEARDRDAFRTMRRMMRAMTAYRDEYDAVIKECVDALAARDAGRTAQ
jgi:hypothetical protein